MVPVFSGKSAAPGPVGPRYPAIDGASISAARKAPQGMRARLVGIIFLGGRRWREQSPASNDGTAPARHLPGCADTQRRPRPRLPQSGRRCRPRPSGRWPSPAFRRSFRTPHSFRGRRRRCSFPPRTGELRRERRAQIVAPGGARYGRILVYQQEYGEREKERNRTSQGVDPVVLQE